MDLLKRLQESSVRDEVKAFIDKELTKAPYPYPVSTVEGNMYLYVDLFPSMEKALNITLSDEEKAYGNQKLWAVQKYTNWSGD